MTSRAGSPPLLLSGAATVAVAAALAADIALGEHPTHSAVLTAVVVVVAALRRFGCRAVAALPTMCAALAAQPALHLMSDATKPQTSGNDPSNLLLHLLVSEVPTAGVQIAVPALAIVAVTLCVHLLHLRIVRRTFATSPAPRAQSPVVVPVRARRLGSMLHWCGWVLQAARRGPPSTAGHAIS